MSDYAGIIGGVVGAVVGYFAGGQVAAGAQWGYAIGSALGGAYAASQQVIPGPKIGDIQKQTSQEGGFRPIVYGRSTPLSGNVLADSEPKIVKKEEDSPGGKGGPKVETEYAYRTYAVGFCEGEASLLQVWRNGILVYNTEDPSMGPENAKFLEYARWYRGSFEQNADPALEAIFGVGNAPFFRGTAYLVLSNEDVTDQRGAWSQWQVRVFRGAAVSYTTPPYPLLLSDSISLAFAPTGGDLRQLVVDGALDPDQISLALVPTGGQLLELSPPELKPDEIDLAFAPTSGAMSDVPEGATDDEIDLIFAPTSGDLRAIPAGNFADEVELTFSPTGGSLT